MLETIDRARIEPVAGAGPERRIPVVAVANKKGGTGKSTVVVNLAAEYAARGNRVLVVDLDAQGHAGLGFGRVAGRGTVTAHDVLRHRSVVLDGHLTATDDPRIDLLPADRDFDGDVRVSDPACLAKALAAVGADHDLVLIDTPPSAPRLIVAALMAADAVLVPTLLDHLSFDGVGQFLRTFHAVVARYRAGPSEALIVPTRIDLRSTMQQTVFAQFRHSYGRGRMAAGVRIDSALAEAFGAHQPLRRYRPAARANRDFARLVEEIGWAFPALLGTD